MNKKLTNTKGFPLVMMVLAFLFSAAGVVQEFAMNLVYKNVFKGDNLVDYVLLNGKGFFEVYGDAVTAFVFTFLVMFALIGGVGKKTTGTKEGVLLICSGVALAVEPACNTIKFLIDGGLKGTESDGELFRAVNQLVCYALPVLVALLVILSGLGILIKAVVSKTTVEVFRNNTAAAPATPEVKEEIPAPVVEEVAPVVEEISAPVAEEVAPAAEEAVAVIEEASNVCKACGGEIAEGAKFCRHCGAKLG